MTADFAAIAYLVSGVMFILALRGLSSPETSRRGNILGMSGMALAVVVTLSLAGIGDGLTWGMIVAGVAIGGTIGAIIARRIPMTAMPPNAPMIAIGIPIATQNATLPFRNTNNTTRTSNNPVNPFVINMRTRCVAWSAKTSNMSMLSDGGALARNSST